MDLMLVLSGICFSLAICGIFSNTSVMKKFYLFIMDMGAAILMLSDRFAYIYRGNITPLGYWMVRICNFLTMFIILVLILSFNGYLIELCKNNPKIRKLPVRLKINRLIIALGALLLVISQFTGLYYTFDEKNQYQRSDGFFLYFLIPMIAWMICFSVLIQNHSGFSRRMFTVLMLFCTLPIIATVAQIFFYGVSLANITITLLTFILRILEIEEARKELEKVHIREKELMEKEQESTQRLFTQTATALVNAIDAKDPYTHGHSSRVAEYSRRLAEMNRKSERECTEIYYSALVHDVGKIGVPRSIINKSGRLTDEEYTIIKQHPIMGVQILESISEFPALSIGAHYHHERYDGKGYPDGVKGQEIPEIARIIAVADAYDAMTSKRSYRDPIPQQKVREEIVKGTGTQFDPVYARLMLHLIDVDTEYEMREREEVRDDSGRIRLNVAQHGGTVTDGILINACMTFITLSLSSDDEASGITPMPSMILFDSLDGKVHKDAKEINDLNYFEYGEIMYNGQTITGGARKIQTKIIDKGSDEIEKNGSYKIEAVRIQDHALIRVMEKTRTAEIIIALPDSSRYMYIGLTGEHCRYSDINTVKAATESPEDYIPRIAEKISYINGPEGDLPNVQIDGYRYEHTKGIAIKNGLRITFHAMSLPTARLVWHCPCIDLFCSDDGTVYGENYRDLAFMRIDGEFWESDPGCSAKLNVTKTPEFKNWDAWKKFNKDGFDVEIRFEVDDNRITLITENAGIAIRNTAVLTGIDRTVYASVTGDQVAVTDIRIKYTDPSV